jgi:hypothetical protein
MLIRAVSDWSCALIICSKNARVSRVSRQPPCLGQRLPQQAHYEYVSKSRLHLLLRRAAVRPNRFPVVRRTLFKLKQRRRQATHGRLRCAVRPCVARRVSLERNVTARPREQANNEHARDSWSTTTVVVLRQASEGVQRCVATVVANRIAQSGRVGLVGGIVQKTRRFLSQTLPRLGQRSPWSARCMHATRSRI